MKADEDAIQKDPTIDEIIEVIKKYKEKLRELKKIKTFI